MNEEIEKEFETKFFANNGGLTVEAYLDVKAYLFEKLHQRDEELEKLLKEEYAKGYAQSKRFHSKNTTIALRERDEKWKRELLDVINDNKYIILPELEAKIRNEESTLRDEKWRKAVEGLKKRWPQDGTMLCLTHYNQALDDVINLNI